MRQIDVEPSASTSSSPGSLGAYALLPALVSREKCETVDWALCFCALFISRVKFKSHRKVWKLWVPIHQSSLMQVYYISGFQRCFRCRVPKPDFFCASWDFLGWLSVSTIIYGYLCYLYNDLLYSGELGQQARCSLSRFLGKSGNSWPWMPTSTAPNIFEDLRHAAIMQLPPRRYHGHAREVLIRIIQTALEHSFHVFPAWLTKRNLPKMTSSNLGVSWSLHCLKHFLFFLSLSLSMHPEGRVSWQPNPSVSSSFISWGPAFPTFAKTILFSSFIGYIRMYICLVVSTHLEKNSQLGWLFPICMYIYIDK